MTTATFPFRRAEVGHVHTEGIVDIPFPRSIRDALLADGLAEEHHWVPNSGWVTFRIRDEQDLRHAHALWLLPLSYLRFALKTDSNPEELFQKATDEMHLNSRFALLLRQFLLGMRSRLRQNRFQLRPEATAAKGA